MARFQKQLTGRWDPEDGTDVAVFHLEECGIVERLRISQLLVQSQRPMADEEAKARWFGEACECAIRVCTGWEGVTDQDGEPAECTEENKRRFFSQTPEAIVHALLPLVTRGREDADRKKDSGGGSDSLSETPPSIAASA